MSANEARKKMDIQENISIPEENDAQRLQISDRSELGSKTSEMKTNLDQSCVINTDEINIEDLDVVIADNDESAFAFSISHEVVIHENNNNDCKPVSIHTTCNDNISDNALKIVGNPLDNVIVPNQMDFDKITAIPENEDQVQKTPVKLDFKPVQLHDILVLPKTPKRKGIKNTEKVTFVLTSAEWQNRENAKKREKELNEEQIKKRKEEREIKNSTPNPNNEPKKLYIKIKLIFQK